MKAVVWERVRARDSVGRVYLTMVAVFEVGRLVGLSSSCCVFGLRYLQELREMI